MDNTDKIVKFFDKIVKKVEKLKRKNPQFNKGDLITKIEDIIEPLEKKKITWSRVEKDIKNSILDLPEYYVDGLGKNHRIDFNHYLMEQIRLPQRQDPTLKEVLEMAFNIGLKRGSMKGSKASDMDKLRYFLKDREIDKLSTVLDNNVMSQILSIL